MDDRHYIVGTAGHVDHGKTTLTRALTGVDTDRLKEEKERALSIDLGFAPLPLASGRRASMVDVPGHERFVKNMVAGVTSLDLVLLVVAADEGVMPQTREHLDIVTLLDVRAGVVALTKADLVDPDWLRLITSEIRKALLDTPFAEAPMIPCSGVTGEGCEEVRAAVDALLPGAPPRDLTAPFKMSIDRVFTMKGFGAVVTGSVDRGRVGCGTELDVLPGGRRARVRAIEVHGAPVDEARAGQRAALNLQGLPKEALERGETLCAPGSLRPTGMVDAEIRVLPGAANGLVHWQRVRVHTGTAETLGRVVILGEGEALGPGRTGYVQLRLETPIAVAVGDRCVLRSYSPAATIAGGPIVDSNPDKHRGRERREVVGDLAERSAGSASELLAAAARAAGLEPTGGAALLAKAGLAENDEALAALADLRASRALTEVGGAYVATEAFEALVEGLVGSVAAYHDAHPLRAAMPRADLRAAHRATHTAVFRAAVEAATARGRVAAVGTDAVRLANFGVRLSPEEQAACERVAGLVAEAGLVGRPTAEVACGGDGEVVRRLLEIGDLVEVGEALVAGDAVERARETLVAHLRAHGEIRVSEFRDLLGSSRKAVVPLMEFFDASGVTVRKGDVRVLSARGERR